MQCPFCAAPDTRVIDSRLAGDGSQVRRRRECVDCAERFTTYEDAALNMPRIVKSDNTREHFDDKKLHHGVLKALEKRPVNTERIDAAVSKIKRKLLSTGEREISSLIIGELVMHELRALDHVAYIRFASVYRRFEDIQAFQEVIDHLEQELSPEMRKNQLPLIDDNEQ